MFLSYNAKLLFLNRWMLAAVFIAIGALMYVFGLDVAAIVFIMTALSFIVMRGAYKNREALSTTFLSGALIGIAGIAWVYALCAVPLLVFYLYGPMKGGSVKLFLSFVLGFLTPYWCYLPYYLWTNHATIANALATFDVNDLLSMFNL